MMPTLGDGLTDAGTLFGNVTSTEVMPLCMRGRDYQINVHRTRQFPGTRLHNLVEDWLRRYDEGVDLRPVYIDRNPLVFNCVLDYYITGDLHLPEALCGGQVMAELDYWGIAPDNIAPCCLANIQMVWEKNVQLKDLIKTYENAAMKTANAHTWREKAWVQHTQPFTSRLGIAMYVCICMTYFLFLVSLTLQSQAEFRVAIQEEAVNHTDTLLEYYWRTRLVSWLTWADVILLTLITLYVATWFVICPTKKEMVSITGIAVYSSVLVQWLPVLINVFDDLRLPLLFPLNNIQVVKIARILPVFGLVRPLKSSRTLLEALNRSWNELGLLLILISISSAFFGYLVFLSEVHHSDTHFRSIPDGFWWGVVTLTTVGYGDMYPQTSAGRIVGVACAVVGILVVALPVPVISGNFTKIYDLVEVAEYHMVLKENTKGKINVHARQETVLLDISQPMPKII